MSTGYGNEKRDRWIKSLVVGDSVVIAHAKQQDGVKKQGHKLAIVQLVTESYLVVDGKNFGRKKGVVQTNKGVFRLYQPDERNMATIHRRNWRHKVRRAVNYHFSELSDNSLEVIVSAMSADLGMESSEILDKAMATQ